MQVHSAVILFTFMFILYFFLQDASAGLVAAAMISIVPGNKTKLFIFWLHFSNTSALI